MSTLSARVRLGSAAATGLLTLLGGHRELPAQNRPVVIAILPFEDRGSFGQDKEVFRALRLGIPATIAAELSGHPELSLADRQRLSRALKSQNQGGGRLDAATAATIGKEAGARYAITGNFADFYGKFSLSARVVDVETGQIVKVVSNDDPALQDRANLYRIVQTVGHKVLAAAGAGGATSATDTEDRVIPTNALTDYSLGLLYESQGDKTRAAQHYDQALADFPGYIEARDGARRVRGP